jgi:hypothetical protein
MFTAVEEFKSLLLLPTTNLRFKECVGILFSGRIVSYLYW